MTLLSRLLSICDDPSLYAAAKHAGNAQRKGCRGINYAGKPHILDAINILDEIWKAGTYVSPETIVRCWRKSQCLPVLDQCDIVNEVARSDKNTKQIDEAHLTLLCDRMKQLSVKMSALPDIPTMVQGSLADPSGHVTALNDDAMRSGLEFWIQVEENEAVQEAEIVEIVDNFIDNLKLSHQTESEQPISQQTESEQAQTSTSAPEPLSIASEPPSNVEIEQALESLVWHADSSKSEKNSLLCRRLSHEMFLERA